MNEWKNLKEENEKEENNFKLNKGQCGIRNLTNKDLTDCQTEK